MKRSVILAFLAVVSSPLAWGQESSSSSTLQTQTAQLSSTRPDGNVPLGAPVQWVAPKYPRRALDRKIQGDVVLQVSVNEKGEVKDVSAVSGDPELAEAAIHAVRKWKYAPYFRDGRGVPATTVDTLRFKITDAGRPDISLSYQASAPGSHQAPVPGQVFKVGNGVTAPKVLSSSDPQYPPEARAAKFQGTCVLSVIVGPDGKPYDIHITRALGRGLDEQAVEAVRRWRFAPATKDGKPVAVAINVRVQFKLY